MPNPWVQAMCKRGFARYSTLISIFEIICKLNNATFKNVYLYFEMGGSFPKLTIIEDGMVLHGMDFPDIPIKIFLA